MGDNEQFSGSKKVQWTRLHSDIQQEAVELMREEFSRNNDYTDILKKSMDSYFGCRQGVQCFGSTAKVNGFFDIPEQLIETKQYKMEEDTNVRISMSMCPLRSSTKEVDSVCFVDWAVKAAPLPDMFLTFGDKTVPKTILVHDKGPACMQFINADMKTEFADFYNPQWQCYIHHCYEALDLLWNNMSLKSSDIRRSIMFYRRDEVNVGSGIVANHRCRWIVTRTFDQPGVYFDKNGKPCAKDDCVFSDRQKVVHRATRTRAVIDIFTTTWSMSGKEKTIGLFDRITTDDNVMLNQEVTVSVVYDFDDSYRCEETIRNALKIITCNMNKVENADARVFSWNFGMGENIGMWTIANKDLNKYHFQTFAKNVASEWLHTNFYVMYEQKMRNDRGLSEAYEDNFAFRVDRSWNMLPQTVFTPTSSFMVYGSTATHVQSSTKSPSVMINTVLGVLHDKFDPNGSVKGTETKLWTPPPMDFKEEQARVLPHTTTNAQMVDLNDEIDIEDVLKLASMPSFFDNTVYM